MKDILAQYPKTRSVLPQKYKDIYTKEYKLNRNGETLITKLSMKLENWLHKKVANDSIDAARILEIGAGTLNHVSFEKKYSIYDVVEPFEELYRNSPQRVSVNKIFESITDVPLSQKYDRILSVATLEHVTDLPVLVAYSGLLLDEKGFFQASIPTQGSLLWYTMYNMTTGLAYYIRNKLNYNVLMNHEHVNTYREIESIVSYFFDKVSISRFPVDMAHLSLYSYVCAQKANIQMCCDYLEERGYAVSITR